MSVTMKWHGAKAKSQARAGAAQGLKRAADYLLAQSQPLVPVSPWHGGGYLKGTGVASVDTGALRAAVSYDGDFAIYVHEIMSRHHTVGQAKFLEQPLTSNQAALRDMIARGIQSRLGA
jgi:hypothetical protein